MADIVPLDISTRNTRDADSNAVLATLVIRPWSTEREEQETTVDPGQSVQTIACLLVVGLLEHDVRRAT